MVPVVAELLMLRSTLYGNYEDTADLLKEVTEKQSQREKRR